MTRSMPRILLSLTAAVAAGGFVTLAGAEPAPKSKAQVTAVQPVRLKLPAVKAARQPAAAPKALPAAPRDDSEREIWRHQGVG